MLSSLKERRDREEGFTLIELMVVVLIIAILLAIAIPTFLGARNTANARAAQSNLRNALTAEQTEWTNTQSFSTDSTTMSGIEASLNWTTSFSTTNTGNEILVSSPSSSQITMTAYGKDGNCWSIFQNNDPSATASFPDGTYYNKTAAATANTCSTPAAPTAAATAGSAASGSAGGWYTSF